MKKTYVLNLTVGDRLTSTPFPSLEDAIDAIIDAFMLTYPDDEDIHEIPEPIDELELRAFIMMKRLDSDFRFDITEEDADQGKP
ncbi:hypothetical protein QCN27_18050 [Cereibacter sp. SYSU M97828]|nr:hypothetical protein [Cereibacter flavus]